MNTSAPTRLYNDVQGLSQLRADAAKEVTPEAAREAARQFEALFVQMMLKSMRDANSSFGEGGDQTYQDMFDQQLSVEMTRGKGLGLADMLVRQLQMTGLAPTGSAAGAGEGSFLTQALEAAGAARTGATADAASTSAPSNRDFRPASPAEFVREIWPHAQAVGKELDVDPRAIVAQAALETGWGARQVRDDAGVSGMNLFNIKADARWDGRRTTVQTLEYEGGTPRLERAQFRAYDSLAEGFADYANFLKDNPRYAEALRHGQDPARYAAGLQAAGYATDPAYARKITDILAGPTLAAVLDGPASTGTALP